MTYPCGLNECNKKIIHLNPISRIEADKLKKDLIEKYIKTASTRIKIAEEHLQPLILVNYCNGCPKH
jgi:hypothetical protein